MTSERTSGRADERMREQSNRYDVYVQMNMHANTMMLMVLMNE
jgi:hypothetical protein